MKSIILFGFLMIVVSCSTPKTEEPVQTPDQKTESTTSPATTSDNKSAQPSTVKKTLNTVAKPFKKFGAGVEQAFDRLSTKDKDGDGE